MRLPHLPSFAAPIAAVLVACAPAAPAGEPPVEDLESLGEIRTCLDGSCGACRTCVGECLCTGGGDLGDCRDECAEPPAPPDAGPPAPPPDDGEPPGDTPPGPAPALPPLPAACPTIASGTVNVLGQDVRLFVGAKRPGTRGPMMFYWHGTGSTSAEASFGLGAALDEIVAEGGVVASFTTTTRSGRNTGNGVWFTGDFAMADILLACAVAQQDVDPRRVYTAGCSAGGLQAGVMAYERSSYLAGAMPNSGGVLRTSTPEAGTPIPAVIAAHGAANRDVVGVVFADTSERLTADIADRGGFAVRCDHGGGHCAAPTSLKAAQWTFLKAHPFGTAPSPFAGGLPAGFPAACAIAP
jgi:dienelactone hydrolase